MPVARFVRPQSRRVIRRHITGRDSVNVDFEFRSVSLSFAYFGVFGTHLAHKTLSIHGKNFIPIRRIALAFSRLLHLPISFSFDASETNRIFAELLIYLVNRFHQFMLLLKAFIVEHSFC